jgi:hypothetical protein
VAPPLVNEEQQQGQQEQQGGSTGAEADNQDLWETASIRSATGGALLQVSVGQDFCVRTTVKELLRRWLVTVKKQFCYTVALWVQFLVHPRSQPSVLLPHGLSSDKLRPVA